ncbi:MAG: pentapeptide repeat-containing protein, partial [Actinomycetota bacterium]
MSVLFNPATPVAGATYSWTVNGVAQKSLKSVAPVVLNGVKAGTYVVGISENFGSTSSPVGVETFVLGTYLYPSGRSMTSGLIGSNLNLSNVNLTGANLSGATLTGVASGGITGTPASLPSGWTLVNGYLVGPGANLTGANLSGANLSGTNLTGTNLANANLTGTNLTGTNLTGTNLTNANLTGADLSNAYLNAAANLSNANLTGANLSNAYLGTANL